MFIFADAEEFHCDVGESVKHTFPLYESNWDQDLVKILARFGGRRHAIVNDMRAERRRAGPAHADKIFRQTTSSVAALHRWALDHPSCIGILSKYNVPYAPEGKYNVRYFGKLALQPWGRADSTELRLKWIRSDEGMPSLHEIASTILERCMAAFNQTIRLELPCVDQDHVEAYGCSCWDCGMEFRTISKLVRSTGLRFEEIASRVDDAFGSRCLSNKHSSLQYLVPEPEPEEEDKKTPKPKKTNEKDNQSSKGNKGKGKNSSPDKGKDAKTKQDSKSPEPKNPAKEKASKQEPKEPTPGTKGSANKSSKSSEPKKKYEPAKKKGNPPTPGKGKG